jgi:hypothetical protein
VKLDTLRRALERGRRLYATSGTTAGADAADELEVLRCRHCGGHIFTAHPSRGSLYMGPIEVLNDGDCEPCVATAGAWRVLDLALSPTAARLAAGTRSDLFHAYGVELHHRRPLSGPDVAPDPRHTTREDETR